MVGGRYHRKGYPRHGFPNWGPHGLGLDRFPPEMFTHPGVFRDGAWGRNQRNFGLDGAGGRRSHSSCIYPAGFPGYGGGGGYGFQNGFPPNMYLGGAGGYGGAAYGGQGVYMGGVGPGAPIPRSAPHMPPRFVGGGRPRVRMPAGRRMQIPLMRPREPPLHILRLHRGMENYDDEMFGGMYDYDDWDDEDDWEDDGDWWSMI